MEIKDVKQLLEQVENLVQRVGELELRVANSDDEIKALSSRITQMEVLSRTV
jgi:uncharacterized coiled-coil protein SlyX